MDTTVKRGYFVRQLEKCADSPQAFIKTAKQSNISQIMLKIADIYEKTNSGADELKGAVESLLRTAK